MKFIKYLISSIAIMVLGTFLFFRLGQDKNSFYIASGKLTYLSKTYKDYPNRDFEKYRYLQIENFSKIIELYIGKESGDFKPDLEKVDSLKLGDSLTVYYDNDITEEKTEISRTVYFIDRGAEPIFIMGDSKKWLSAFVAGMGVIILIVIIILKLKGKLE